jgi:hypothetical protein
MKKILLSLALVAFAAAAQAGDAKVCPFMESAKSGCCSGKGCDQVKTSDQAKGACCSAAKVTAKLKPAKAQVLMSPKAAAEVASK